jgi:hypothetical protein
MPEIRIQIEDDEDDATSKPAQEPIEDIKRRGDAAAAEAVRLRHEADHHRANNARLQVGTALTKAGMEASEAAAEYRIALEAGDIDTQAGATARMVEIEARRVRLQEQAEALERSPLVHHADPVEALAATRTEPTAKWLREHREWVLDPKKNAKLTSAHFDAVGEGLREDTPEYFEHVGRKIGLSDDRTRESGDGAAARPAMKVTADPNTHVQRGGKSVFLSKNERERATDGTLTWNYGPHRGKPIGIQEFARRKAAMHAEGRYRVLDDLSK